MFVAHCEGDSHVDSQGAKRSPQLQTSRNPGMTSTHWELLSLSPSDRFERSEGLRASRHWTSSAGVWQCFITINTKQVLADQWAWDTELWCVRWENGVRISWSCREWFCVIFLEVDLWCACVPVGLLGELVTGRLIHWTGRENVEVTPSATLRLHLLQPCLRCKHDGLRECKTGSCQICHFWKNRIWK